MRHDLRSQGGAILGEGPVWVGSEQAVFWVDILDHRGFARLMIDPGVVGVPEQAFAG